MKKRLTCVSVYSIVFFGVLFAESPKGFVQVTATGSAESRDSALIDACRLAIAKVHGTRILGSMANRNSDGIKIDASGKEGAKDSTFSVFGRTMDVADNTSMTFGGLLLRYEVLNEQKESGPTGRWKIQVKGDVLNTIPDKFSGRQAVVFPGVDRVLSKMRSPELGNDDLENLARKLHDSVRDIFANNPQFVLLERENEDAINKELNRSQGSNAAVMELSKLQGEKAADIVVEIIPNPVKVENKTFTFENTPSLQKVKISISGMIKLLDVSTKGEIGSTKFDVANPKLISASGDKSTAISKAMTELDEVFSQSMRVAKRNLLTSLGLTNVLFTDSNEFAFTSSFDSTLISNGDRVILWKEDAGKKTKAFEEEITLTSKGFTIHDATSTIKNIKAGEAFTFTIIDAANLNKSIEGTRTEEKKQLLKDKVNFDL
jgi:hypothetical protein